MAGNRIPAARLPTGGKAVTSSDLSGALRYYRNQPLSGAVFIEGLVTDGTTNGQMYKHGLGRAFQGAFTVGSDRPTLYVQFSSPKDLVRQGIDPAVWLQAFPSATTIITFNAVVF